MSLVLDASLTMAWAFDDERTPETENTMEEVGRNGAVVPPLWRLEVVNAFQIGIRRHRIDQIYRDKLLARLKRLPISIDQDGDNHTWTTTLRLSDRYGLTIYDACYLELAQRLNLPLASLDQELRAAAHSLGIPLRGA